jgi:hypothetical protein
MRQPHIFLQRGSDVLVAISTREICGIDERIAQIIESLTLHPLVCLIHLLHRLDDILQMCFHYLQGGDTII